MKKLLLTLSSLFLLIAFLLIVGCGLNQNPPSYIKQLSAYKEGQDGFVAYFILADSDGKMTTGSGLVTIKVIEKSYSTDKETELYSKTITITQNSFYKTKIGTGAFERDAIICSFGRITTSSFSKKPKEDSARVKVEFTTNNGIKLQSEDTFYW